MTFRETVETDLKHRRPNLNASSLKTYVSILFNLHKKLDATDESLEWFNDDRSFCDLYRR